MSYEVAPLTNLVEQFQRLPGIGRKTAQRLAFYVLSLSKEKANEFAKAIIDAKEKIVYCEVCGNISSTKICHICSDETRDKTKICVVENHKDVLAFERTREYNGLYHVLGGVISPMEGIGPDQINIKSLVSRVGKGNIKEIIMATNPTVEGEATAMYITKLLKMFDVKITRLAYGIPVGGDLEYADEVTLSRALEGRNELL